ncbi:MAG: CHAT domain-containing protein [Acidobacteria bacterium]|nr:MAG: CHAT domain-containing protein [Acidobacteriota bacterium]
MPVGSKAQLGRLLRRPGAGTGGLHAPQHACPPAEDWYEVAAGSQPPNEARRALAHAAECRACGARLRAAIEDLGIEPAEAREKRGWGLKVAPWAVAAIVILSAALLYSVYQRRHAPAVLLADAYSANRTLAWRLPGAAYAPLTTTRGNQGEAPAALLEAEDRIAHALEREPASTKWLELEARADLLRFAYSEALQHAQAVLKTQPHALDALSDEAGAYFERAEAEGNGSDYDAALEVLGQALAQAPDDRVARFNRALTAERLRLYSLAVSDWRAYLRVESTGAWAEAARQHLQKDEALLATHDKTEMRPLLPPRQFVEAAARGSPALTGQDEAYLRQALEQWLPDAFSGTGAARGPARAAVQALAARLQQRHGDRWLEELLVTAGARAGPEFGAGVAELGRAETANDSGKPGEAAAAAQAARRDFLSPEGYSLPGYWQAELEWVYAQAREEHAAACLQQSGAVISTSAQGQYRWMEAQALLDQSNCKVLAGDVAGQDVDVRRALAIARTARYPGVTMRAEAFLAAAPLAPGSPVLWRQHLETLREFWAEPVSPMWGYQLYMTLALRSAQMQRPHAARDFARAAVAQVSLLPERSFQAIARRQLAVYLTECGQVGGAEKEIQKADQLYATLPATPATRNFMAINDLELARAGLRQGKLKLAAARLRAYKREQPAVENLKNRALPYFELRGQIALAQKKYEPAKQAFQAAIWINHIYLTEMQRDRNRLAWREANDAPYRGLLQVMLAQKAPAQQMLAAWEASRGAVVAGAWPAAPSRELANLNAAGVPAPPEGVELAPGLARLRTVQVISYAVLPKEVVIWRFDDQGIEMRQTPIAAKALQERVRKFAVACANPAPDARELDAEAEQLYSWLIAPVAKDLDPARTLVIEADPTMGPLPFAALRDGQGTWLGERFALEYAPGLAYAGWAGTGPAVTTGSRLLAVADPASGNSYAPLPEAAEEASAIAAQFHHAQVLEGPQATPAAVVQGLRQAEVFHFAGHAEEMAGEVRLVLAGSGPGMLGPEQIPRRGLQRCRLAVLAACTTAPGAAGAMDATTLVRALLRAGVANVAASLWPVDSESTAQLDRAFYSALLAGKSPARALQMAEVTARRRPGRAAPYYWASFGLFSTEYR